MYNNTNEIVYYTDYVLIDAYFYKFKMSYHEYNKFFINNTYYK